VWFTNRIERLGCFVARHRFGDLEKGDGARTVVVGAVADGVEPRRVCGAQAVPDGGDACGLVGCRRRAADCRRPWANDAVVRAQGVVIDGRVVEADVIVMRGERDVLATQLRIRATQDGNDVPAANATCFGA
jgi:hypothetical protein